MGSVTVDWVGSEPARVTAFGLRLGGDADADTRRLLALLPPDEQRRAADLPPVARRQFVHGRALLRTALGARLAAPAATLVLVPGPNGKPRLASPVSEIAFNVAHSGAYVVVGVGPSDEVGVDVEPVRAMDPRVVRRVLGPAADSLDRFPPARRDSLAVHHWVVREACAKARALTIASLPGIPSTSDDTGRHGDLRWDVVEPWPSVKVAVARPWSVDRGRPPAVRLVTPADVHRAAVGT